MNTTSITISIEGETLCGHCGRPGTWEACGTCARRSCVDCAKLFHGLHFDGCKEWPSDDRSFRANVLRKLKVDKQFRASFIEYLSRLTFIPSPNKIYVAITAQQRGDFHKFKWSIGCDPHLFALLPLNAVYEESWLKDLISRAEMLDAVAGGRWLFIHSSLLVSSRDREGNDSEEVKLQKRWPLKGYAGTPFHVAQKRLVELQKHVDKTRKHLGRPVGEVSQLAALTPSLFAVAGFTAWAFDEKTRSTIYNIDTIVPLYNSMLVMTTRREFLEHTTDSMLDRGVCNLLVEVLCKRVEKRCVLVLWGSRTGGKREYLDEELAVREFRHKTSKTLVRRLLAASKATKVTILAGDPLGSDTGADIDLTCMWEAETMERRFGIKHSFGRLEQEYVFFELSKLCVNTVHIGMQSGNIETLVNNPNTNVICVNENTKGGAGLVNVTRITGFRDDKVRDGKLPPCHLYLPFNLPVLPSRIGELTRLLMERYGEGVTMGVALVKLAKEWMGERAFLEWQSMSRKKPLLSKGSHELEEVLLLEEQPLMKSLDKGEISIVFEEKRVDVRALIIELGKHAPCKVDLSRPPDMLIESGDKLLAKLLVHFALKLAGGEKSYSSKVDEIELLRPELQLLCCLAASTRPKVQYIFCRLNNVYARPLRTKREILLDFLIVHIEFHELFAKYKKRLKEKYEKDPSLERVGALPTEREQRAKVLFIAFREMALEAGDHEAELLALWGILSESIVPTSGLKLSNTVLTELEYDPVRQLEREWTLLLKFLKPELEDSIELEPVAKFFKLPL